MKPFLKRLLSLVLVFVMLLSGCAVADVEMTENASVETTLDPMATWDPFVGGFEYVPGRIYLETVDNEEYIQYNIAYRHKDETVEILVEDVSRYSTWKLVDQRLYYVAWDGLYAKDLPDGLQSFLEIDHQQYVGVSSILDIQGDQLLCGAKKWVKNTDPAVSGAPTQADTQIWVKLDFSEYKENPDFLPNP